MIYLGYTIQVVGIIFVAGVALPEIYKFCKETYHEIKTLNGINDLSA